METDLRKLSHLHWEVQMMLRSSMHKLVSGVGLYMGQPWILGFIRERGEVSQKEIADALMISPPTVATSLKRMNKAGLIAQAVDEGDTRRNVVTLTEKGGKTYQRFLSGVLELDNGVYKGLNGNELTQFAHVLTVMKANLASMGAQIEPPHRGARHRRAE